MPTMDKPIQFGIRHLLGAMFVVSLAAALIAPWVRGWSASQWLVLGTQTAVVAVTFVLFLGANVWSRKAVRQMLGEVFFVAQAKTWGQRVWRPSSAYLTLAFATLMLFMFTAVTIASGGRDFGPFIHGIYGGIFAAMGVNQLRYPPDEMLIGERGMSVGGWQFIHWGRVAFAYQPEHRTAPFFIKTIGWAYELSVPAELEQPLTQFLGTRAKAWANPPQRRKVPRP